MAMSSSRHFSVFGVALSGATALAMVPTAALGHEMVRGDAAKDVTLLTISDASSTATVDPDVADGDITRLRAAHAKYRVKARLKFRALTKNGNESAHSFRIQTDSDYFQVVTFAYPGSWKGQTEIFSGMKDVRCRGLRHEVDYVDDTVSVSVPRSCLGRPRWVRIGAVTSQSVNDGTIEVERLLLDAAGATGEDGEDPYSATPEGRRLRRC